MNKLYKSLALLTVVAGVAFTGCSTEGIEADYEPAAPVAGMQVFFPDVNAGNIELNAGQESFSVPVQRVDTTEAANIPLKVEAKEGSIYTVPSELAFEAGQKMADLVITVDVEKQEYNTRDTIVVEIADQTTPYGASKLNIYVSCPEPWTPWCRSRADWVNAGFDADSWQFGDADPMTVTYTYTKIFRGDDADIPMYYRQNKINPEQGQIRIDDWCYGVSLILDYNPLTHNIQIPLQTTGYVDDGVGEFFITDVTGWQNADYYDKFPCTYNPETGFGLLNTAWMAGDNATACYGYGEEYFQVGGYYIPDYTVSALYQGILTDKDQNAFAQIIVEMGTDVQSAKAVIMEKGVDPEAVADAVAAGDLESVDLVEGINNIALGEATGELTIIILAIADEEVKSVTSINFEHYAAGNASPWVSLGMGLYTDDFIAPLFGVAPPTYSVEIKENTEKPGLYRVMNPYSNSVYPLADDDFAEEGLYLEVDATNPDYVFIAPQSIGCDFGVGDAAVCSFGGYYMAQGYTAEVLVANEIYGGTLKDGVITFHTFEGEDGEGNIGYYQGIVFMDGKAFADGGMNGMVKIVLPEAVSAEEVAKAKVSAKRASLGKMTRVSKAVSSSMNKKMIRAIKPVQFK